MVAVRSSHELLGSASLQMTVTVSESSRPSQTPTVTLRHLPGHVGGCAQGPTSLTSDISPLACQVAATSENRAWPAGPGGPAARSGSVHTRRGRGTGRDPAGAAGPLAVLGDLCESPRAHATWGCWHLKPRIGRATLATPSHRWPRGRSSAGCGRHRHLRVRVTCGHGHGHDSSPSRRLPWPPGPPSRPDSDRGHGT